jgi:hypothetical protein
MSESYGSVSATRPEESTETKSTMDAAKQEAAGVKDTAKAEAGHVVDTAKGEAKAVATEAKGQARHLYAQTKNELRDQAGVQQQRAAAGLRSIGDELRSLASGETPQNSGLATDLVRQASQRVSSAASWLGDRDPVELLDEVKAYARRRPAVFITAAAIAGVVAGRLARALTEHNAEEKADSQRGYTQGGHAQGSYTPSPSAASGPTSYSGVVGETTYPATGSDDLTETPLYAERSTSLSGGITEEGGDGYVRHDSV